MAGGFKVKLKFGSSLVSGKPDGHGQREAGASNASSGPGAKSSEKKVRQSGTGKESGTGSKKRPRKEEHGQAGHPVSSLPNEKKPPKPKKKAATPGSLSGDPGSVEKPEKKKIKTFHVKPGANDVGGKIPKLAKPKKSTEAGSGAKPRIKIGKGQGSDSSAGVATGAVKKKTKQKLDKVKVKLRDQVQPEDSAATTSMADGGLYPSNFSEPGLEEADSKAGLDWQTDATNSAGGILSDGDMMHESASTNNLVRRDGGSQATGFESPAPTPPTTSAPKPPAPPKKELEKIVDKIQKKDIYEIFKEPVTEDVAPGYFSIVEKPMDFATMRTKVLEDKYESWEELEADLMLMFDNAMLYNGPDTIYHQLALTMKNLASKLVELGKQGVHSFRGRTAAIMRAHNIAQEVSVAKALAAESAEEAQYLSENAVAIDFGKSQGGRREKELPPVRPGGEDLRSTYQQAAGPVTNHVLGVFRNGASTEGVALASTGISMRPVQPLYESAFLRSTSRFIAGLKGKARAYALASVAKSIAAKPQQATPQAAPQAAPQQAVPQAAPQAIPQAAPQAVPQAVPQAIPQAAPQAVPQAAPQAIPQTAPQAAPQAAPVAIPQAVPQAIPQAAPQAAPVAIPQAAPQAVPHAIPQAVPQAVPQQLANS